jgi:hypothetical protein
LKGGTGLASDGTNREDEVNIWPFFSKYIFSDQMAIINLFINSSDRAILDLEMIKNHSIMCIVVYLKQLLMMNLLDQILV